ncbi:MAG: transcription elongation factor Spt5 [Candidatus Thermoplasmatota archaeon]|jgi:transcriptional antiterminator NusG|nr:transcription elongation factor Spt5 [Candidatus Thermoplasmatota archaeon]MCL5789535.1 transcription elongation factor Spt5 [Candidatus Thermoplasmatota archaeon]
MVKWTCDGKDSEVGTNKKVAFNLVIENDEPSEKEGSVDITLDIHEQKEEIEWFVIEEQKRGKQVAISPKNQDVLKIQYKLKPKESMVRPLSVETPKGGEIGDYAIAVLKEDGKQANLFTIKVKQTIIVVKTTIGQEVKIARDIGLKARIEKHDYLFSILVPPDVKGYIFIETLYPDRTMALLRTIRGARNMIAGEVQLSEIENYLVSKPAVESLGVGNYVEVTEGPFKGEKARITHVDTQKDEITLELQNAIVPIPLTVKADSVKLLEKEV